MKTRTNEQTPQRTAAPISAVPVSFEDTQIPERVQVQIGGHDSSGTIDRPNEPETRLRDETAPERTDASRPAEDHDQLVAERAYYLYLNRGEQHRDELADWLEAERQIQRENEAHARTDWKGATGG